MVDAEWRKQRRAKLILLEESNIPHTRAKLWNSLPDDITSASSFTAFRRKLKTRLFPDSILCSLSVIVLATVMQAVIYLGRLKNCYLPNALAALERL